MLNFNRDYIRRHVACTDVIFQRGLRLYQNGAFSCTEADPGKGSFVYEVDGSYGDYTTRVRLLEDGYDAACSCPFPEKGCKHTVAVALDILDRVSAWKDAAVDQSVGRNENFLSVEEIRKQALEDREKKARQESFKVTEGDMLKGEHLIRTPRGREYVVTLHDPSEEKGHCTCPDFLTNRLGTCKHIIFICSELGRKKDFKKRIVGERFPFVDIFWDSIQDRPRIFLENPGTESPRLRALIAEYFDPGGLFSRRDLSEALHFINRLDGDKRVRVQEFVLEKLDERLQEQELSKMMEDAPPPPAGLKAHLYPYQEEGVRFGLHRRAALIGDEMGLGKTLQAIALGLQKREVFGFKKILVVTLASLKEQWKREIERFTDEKAVLIQGGRRQRTALYETDPALFKITNYEALLRDVFAVSRFKPDLVILDEAQRIKNFSTKTAEAVKSIPRKHALVLTGTPLENKLEDVYSIVQFLQPNLLSPLWKFAADHFMLSREKKGKILGYRNLDLLKEKLKPVVIRRKKEEVLSDLPDEVVNTYYLDLDQRQREIHQGYLGLLIPILNKKFLTPIDIKRMQELLLGMRRVCDSTYLIDRETNISPKLAELEGILEELVLQNRRKTVIFSEWTTMTFLIGKQLSAAGIPFVELTGKVPVQKRQALIDAFTSNPECMVFLSTDAGGTGLNLQAADCVINFEIPWNPARLNQRVGRVNRIGQKSRCVNVVNLVSKNSIEEKILAGLQLKADLFSGVFESGPDKVEFSREKRTEMLNRLREMMGEESVPMQAEPRASEDIPEDTPHYLNPRVLEEADRRVDFAAEETQPIESTHANAGEGTNGGSREESPSAESPEKMEEVLNSGLQFLSGVLEMATGKKLEPAKEDGRMIRIDRETGEVTMKFRLPGFGSAPANRAV